MVNKKFKKEIILLKQVANRGKTTSINLLYNEVIGHFELSETLRTAPYDNNDFQKVLTVKGINIGFGSEGDVPDAVKGNCDFFKNNNCSICVTACQTDGNPNDKNLAPLIEFSQEENYDTSSYDFISWDDDTNRANQEKASMMLNRIIHLLKLHTSKNGGK